ncbi:hypothetical protein F5X96DRAFT_671849 [Biscogniauxia mediterranea]|nr:hypothetical protein F5X96DRAFT_671849 [Biscogniauxia mediterranea]
MAQLTNNKHGGKKPQPPRKGGLFDFNDPDSGMGGSSSSEGHSSGACSGLGALSFDVRDKAVLGTTDIIRNSVIFSELFTRLLTTVLTLLAPILIAVIFSIYPSPGPHPPIIPIPLRDWNFLFKYLQSLSSGAETGPAPPQQGSPAQEKTIA